MNAVQDWREGDIPFGIGDLVEIIPYPGYMQYEEPTRFAIITELGYPPRGSLQIFRIQVLTASGIMSVDRSQIKKVE